MNKLVLFDIDGILIKTGSKNHKLSFSYAFKQIYGVDTNIDIIDHSGKVDKQIIIEVLKKEGLDEQTIRSKIDKAMKEMEVFFESNIADGGLSILSGVEELIKKLSENNVLLGITTGNLKSIAEAKLKNIDLDEYFKVGGFGSDDEHRVNLIKIAIERAENNFNFNFNENVFVIGDTPRDIKAGKEAGVKTVAVLTGEYSEEELRSEHPDFLFEDLTNNKKILKAILNEK